jgi:hypothetical protein
LEDADRRTKKQVICSEYLSCELKRGEESRTELWCESERERRDLLLSDGPSEWKWAEEDRRQQEEEEKRCGY